MSAAMCTAVESRWGMRTVTAVPTNFTGRRLGTSPRAKPWSRRWPSVETQVGVSSSTSLGSIWSGMSLTTNMGSFRGSGGGGQVGQEGGDLRDEDEHGDDDDVGDDERHDPAEHPSQAGLGHRTGVDEGVHAHRRGDEGHLGDLDDEDAEPDPVEAVAGEDGGQQRGGDEDHRDPVEEHAQRQQQEEAQHEHEIGSELGRDDGVDQRGARAGQREEVGEHPGAGHEQEGHRRETHGLGHRVPDGLAPLRRAGADEQDDERRHRTEGRRLGGGGHAEVDRPDRHGEDDGEEQPTHEVELDLPGARVGRLGLGGGGPAARSGRGGRGAGAAHLGTDKGRGGRPLLAPLRHDEQDDGGGVHEDGQQPGPHAREQQLADALLGDHPVQDQDDRGRDEHAEGAAGADDAGGELDAVARLDDGVGGHARHGGDGGDAGAGDGREEAGPGQRGERGAAGEAAQHPGGDVEAGRGQAAVDGEDTHDDEQRDDRQRVVRGRGERLVRGGADGGAGGAQHEDADEPRDHERQRHVEADRQQSEEDDDDDEQGDETGGGHRAATSSVWSRVPVGTAASRSTAAASAQLGGTSLPCLIARVSRTVVQTATTKERAKETSRTSLAGQVGRRRMSLVVSPRSTALKNTSVSPQVSSAPSATSRAVRTTPSTTRTCGLSLDSTRSTTTWRPSISAAASPRKATATSSMVEMSTVPRIDWSRSERPRTSATVRTTSTSSRAPATWLRTVDSTASGLGTVTERLIGPLLPYRRPADRRSRTAPPPRPRCGGSRRGRTRRRSRAPRSGRPSPRPRPPPPATRRSPPRAGTGTRRRCRAGPRSPARRPRPWPPGRG